MKKFKDFVKSKKSGVSRIPHPHEMYVAVIHHGSHSQVRDKSSSKRSSSKKKKVTEETKYDDIDEIFDSLTRNAHGISDYNTEPLMRQLAAHPSIDTDNNPYADQFKNYTSSSYNMNNSLYEHHLRGMYGDDGYHPDMLKHVLLRGKMNLPRMDHAVHYGSAPNDLTVFSGLKWQPPKIIGGKPNKIFLPSFTSTSLNAGITSDFMNQRPVNVGERQILNQHLAQFHVPSGTPIGVPGHGFSENSHEHEAILARGLVTRWEEPEIRTSVDYDPILKKEYETRVHVHPVHIEDVAVHPRNFKPIT